MCHTHLDKNNSYRNKENIHYENKNNYLYKVDTVIDATFLIQFVKIR